MRQVKYIIQKEIWHILRDSRSLTIAILMPIMMTFLYGYAINFDIKNIKLAILDFDNTTESRELASQFYNSGYFRRPDALTTVIDPERVLKTGAANAVLTIQPGFARALTNLSLYQLGLLVDGSDANLSAATTSYSNIVLNRYLLAHLPANVVLSGVNLSPDRKSVV